MDTVIIEHYHLFWQEASAVKKVDTIIIKYKVIILSLISFFLLKLPNYEMGEVIGVEISYDKLYINYKISILLK